MMNRKDIGSLADYFFKEPTAKETYRSFNPASKVVHNYIFAIDLVKDEVNCAAANDCEWFTAEEADKSYEDLQKLILCITCDRLYHIKCAGLDVTALSEENLPWICHKCTINPLNPEAQALVSSNRHLVPFDERVKHFIKDTTRSKDERESSLESELDQTVHLTPNGSIIDPQFVDIINKLSERYAELEKRHNSLQRYIEVYIKPNSNLTINEGIGKADSNDIGQPAQIASNATYTEAVLQANRVSTLIDEGIHQSQEQRRSLFNFPSIRNDSAAFGSSPTASNESNPVNAIPITGGNSHTVPPPVDGNSMPLSSGSSQTAPQSATFNTNERQVDATMKHLSMLTLNETRKHLPKITSFDGKPEKWLTFQRDVQRNWREGKFSDDMMKHQIRHALYGQALARVEALMDFMTAEQIMSLLKESYGNSSVIVESARQKLLNVKLAKPLTHSSCVEVTTYIANYMAACTYAGLLVTDSNISSRIHSQLEPFHQQMYYEYFFRKFPNATTRMERLDTQFEFLNNLSRTLPIGSFSFKSDENKNNKNRESNSQVHSMSVNSSSDSSNEDYKYEIRDEELARYLGYKMDKLGAITKQCQICASTEHYTVECKTYRDLKINERYDLAKSKNLCINCMIASDHTAKDCGLKIGCGYKVNKNLRCSAKHHVTLHRSNDFSRKQQSRRNSTENAEKAQEKIDKYKESQQTEEPNIEEDKSTEAPDD